MLNFNFINYSFSLAIGIFALSMIYLFFVGPIVNQSHWMLIGLTMIAVYVADLSLPCLIRTFLSGFVVYCALKATGLLFVVLLRGENTSRNKLLI
jgi:hypothetical protein